MSVTVAPTAALRAAARAAQQRYCHHVGPAHRCVCASGGLCLIGERLDREAESAWLRVEGGDGLVNADLIEQLSEAVHIGWMQEKQRQGFADHAFTVGPGDARYCRKRIGMTEHCLISAAMHHADMLPYADLSEPTKEYDRATVRAVLAAIEGTGFQITRAPMSPRSSDTEKRPSER